MKKRQLRQKKTRQQASAPTQQPERERLPFAAATGSLIRLPDHPTARSLRQAALRQTQRQRGNAQTQQLLGRRRALQRSTFEERDEGCAGCGVQRKAAEGARPLPRPATLFVQRQQQETAAAPTGPTYEVVEPDVQIAEPAQIPSLLGLPPDTIPAGAAANPEFLLSLVNATPGASAAQLEEMVGVPDHVVSGLPEGQVVSLSEAELSGLGELVEDEAPPSLTPVPGAMAGADTALTYGLARRGFNAAGPDAIGIVAFPQSRLVRGVTTGKMGPGPLLPESRIVLGHTAVYVRVGGEIQLIRSYASESMIDAILNFGKMRSGTGGVPARIIDHMGETFPPGGRMFDITSGRSIEYAVPQEMAVKFMSQLPEGGPLPGALYTAQPEVAAQLGGARLGQGRNCVHWVASEVESFMWTPVGPGGKSLKDLPAPDAARQGKTMGHLTKGAPDELVRLPNGQEVRPVRGGMSNRMKVFKWGNRLFNVGNVGYSAYRIWEAPADEKLQVIAEELGDFAGGAIGAEAGVGFCVAVGVASGGIGLLLCGIGGGALGSMGGSTVGGALGRFVMMMANLPQITAFAIETVVETMEVMGTIVGLAGAPLQVMAQGIARAREEMNVGNWDLRYLPPALRDDVLAIGQLFWPQLEPLTLDELSGEVTKPLQSYGVSAAIAGRIAETLAGLEEGTQTSVAVSAEEILSMNPLQFVRALQRWKLAYVQAPEYSAGMPGRWDDPDMMRIHLAPLVQARATVNPYNWDVSRVPVIAGVEGSEDIEFGEAIETLGSIVWGQLRDLDEEALAEALRQPLSDFSLPAYLFEEIATGIGQVGQAEGIGARFGFKFGVEPETLKGQTPPDFVQFVRSYGVPLQFRQEPALIAKQALRWVEAGFQPW